MNIVQKAIEASGAGTQARFAEMLGKGQTAVAKYVKAGRFPRSIILEVERVSGIPREELAPELFAGYQPIKRRRKTPETTDA